MRAHTASLCALALGLTASSGFAATLQVGPGKTYSAPCAAIAAAAAGDIIAIDAGTYSGDVCAVHPNNLTLRGVGGLARLDAAGQNAEGKAIWVIKGDNTVVENIEFTGATVPDENGAGIRQEGRNLTVRNCYFHHNENGILGGNDNLSEILIEHSEFANNGFGDGYTHNLYINHVAKLTFQFNYSHNASIGHLLKSRAAENYVLYNRLTGESGTQSYEIDLPNGGRSYVIGNLIHQGQNTDNSSLISYQREGTNPANPNHDLYVVNNTFVNERSGGGTFVNIDGGVAVPAIIRNNIFVGPGTISSQSNAVLENNFQGDPGFVNQANYNYRITAGSPCVNAGTAPGTGAGFALTPGFHYVHPADREARSTVGTIDIGAYELGGSAGAGGTGGSGTGGSGTGGAAGSATGGAAGSGTGGSATGGTAGSGTGGSATGGTGGSSTGGTGGSAASGGSSTGGTGGSSGAGVVPPAPESEAEGCACGIHKQASDGAWGALLALGLMFSRRRRHRLG